MTKLVCARIGCNKTKDIPDLTEGMIRMGFTQICFCSEHSKEMITAPCDQGCGYTPCKHTRPELFDQNGKMIKSRLRKIQKQYAMKLKPEYRA